MRSIQVYMNNGKYFTCFFDTSPSGSHQVWQVESYLIEPLEVMNDWLEKSILPKYNYR